MKTVILAGGRGTRLSEETGVRPKPMVEIGGQPILWHIMKHYAHYGHRDFCVALGYMGEEIKRYFLEYHRLRNDLQIDLVNGDVETLGRQVDDWNVRLVDTGLDTLTGGRVKRLADWIGNDTFLVTYGDGVSNVNLDSLVAFHKSSGKLATLTVVRPPARFGGVTFNADDEVEFTEKPQIGEGWINGGFLVLEPQVLDYLDGDQASLEIFGLEKLAAQRQLAAYRHAGFWQCMDTLRDRQLLEDLWQSKAAPWRTWDV
ncbi:MAG: glucose-1-phosphate cytidylyltransferase [Pirellulaceae bacterium]|jgi:glucose-1-phosphate cytidylyltransferase